MITRRDMWSQVFLTIFTLGLFPIYWFHVTNREMSNHLGRNDSITLWTVLYMIPFVSLIACWKQSHLFQEVTDSRYQWPILFILWIVFAPASWFLTQWELNRIADGSVKQPVPYSAGGAIGGAIGVASGLFIGFVVGAAAFGFFGMWAAAALCLSAIQRTRFSGRISDRYFSAQVASSNNLILVVSRSNVDASFLGGAAHCM